MLFNSYEFLFIFLPITLLVFFYAGSIGRHRVAISWLVGASLFYYGWWNPAYLGLILGSMLFNYSFGVVLGNNDFGTDKSKARKKLLLIIGLICNLSLLGYFKYANFFVDTVNIVANTNWNVEKIILPLAISFFTFQQVAYLVDAYRGETREYSFLHYCLFVCFFPQLIAGPIVHHKEMLPQFAKNETYKFNPNLFSKGMTIFVLGLFKKVVLADSLSIYVGPIFNQPDPNMVYAMLNSWVGSLAYTFQLYFDFSGYSDMAIGIAFMFGINLPMNFNSPYKSTSIVEFWRRWHITLSRFLRDYLYISLGGNRKGKIRTQFNLLTTMLLGGLWHGAGWTFIVWGGLHGAYLIINHLYTTLKNKVLFLPKFTTRFGSFVAKIITFLSVVVAWVFFRSNDFAQAGGIISAMFGMTSFYDKSNPVDVSAFVLILISFFIVWFLPNAKQYMKKLDDSESLNTSKKEILSRVLLFNYNRLSAALIAILFLVSLLVMQSIHKSEFLYYDF